MTSVSDKAATKPAKRSGCLTQSSAIASLAIARQRQPGAAGGEILDRRIGQRDHLAVIAELVHLAKARVEIVDLGHAAQPRRDIAELRRGLVHLLEIALRRDVAVKIDERIGAHEVLQRFSDIGFARASEGAV